jgi:hypothetical protein
MSWEFVGQLVVLTWSTALAAAFVIGYARGDRK